MEVEISPEPRPDEREAIVAVAGTIAAEVPGESPWWRAGLPGGADDPEPTVGVRGRQPGSS